MVFKNNLRPLDFDLRALEYINRWFKTGKRGVMNVVNKVLAIGCLAYILVVLAASIMIGFIKNIK